MRNCLDSSIRRGTKSRERPRQKGGQALDSSSRFFLRLFPIVQYDSIVFDDIEDEAQKT